jgi:hypothetical protein
MRRSLPVIAVIGVLLAGLVSMLATGTAPPRPGTEDNGLTENESAPLWSRDDDSRYISNEVYRETYGENRSTLHQIANGTDLTYKRPPSTARTWTRNDFGDYSPGNASTSVYPTDATLEDSVSIEDAHASVFAVSPSTKTHVDADETVWYVAPEGRLLGTVDYRVRVPSTETVGNRTVSYSLLEHDITEVRLLRDGEVVERTDGTHTPSIAYALASEPRATTLTLEADIEARLSRTVVTRRLVNVTVDEPVGNVSAPNGTVANETNVTQRVEQVVRTTRTRAVTNDSLTVSDSLSVEVYDLDKTFYRARYPDGDTGVSIFSEEPWQGYQLGDGERVRGVWRFYTARDIDWDVLVQSRANGSEEIESPALPVYVHAYPSELGPRAAPVREGPEIIRVWGFDQTSPRSTTGENVAVEVVEQPYTSSYGIAVRTSADIGDGPRVQGIVDGVDGDLVTPEHERERILRESRLSVEVIEAGADEAVLRVELRDNVTDDPIVLGRSSDPRYAPIAGNPRSGYVTVAGERAETNDSGVALVTVEQSGVYTARYHPGSWLNHYPAYTGSTASARWHPLTTTEGWFRLALTALQWSIPFLLVIYAGRKLGSMFRYGFDL